MPYIIHLIKELQTATSLLPHFSWLFPWLYIIAYNHQARGILNVDMLRAVINKFITIEVPCAGQLQNTKIIT